MDKPWKVIATICGVILMAIFSAWMYWISMTVISLASKEREDTAQWDKMRRMEDRMNKYHTIP